MANATPCDSGLRHLDSSQHKAHKHAQVGPEPVEGRKIGKTKGGQNTKLNAITDSRRRPIAMNLTEGQQSEYDGAVELLEYCENVTVVADKGYDSDPFRILIDDWGNDYCIPGRNNRKVAIEVDSEIYKKRHNVENFFCWIKEYRCISTRYEQTPSSFMGFVMLAAAILWIKSPF
jgi:transposase